MHEHDSDLIAALAEGSLSAEEAAAAEASVVPCAECSADLAAHRVALKAIAGSDQPGLSMVESARLRRGVEVALGRAPVVAEEPKRRPWLALVTAGAVVVVLLAVAPLVNLLSTGSDAETAATETTVGLDFSAEAAETAPAATEAPATEAPAAAQVPTEESAADAPPDAAADGAGGLFDRLAEPLPNPVLEFRATGDLNLLLSEVPKGIGDDGVRFGTLTPDEVAYFQEQFETDPTEGVTDCPAEAALSQVETPIGLVTIGTTLVDEAEVVVVIVISLDGEQTVVALDAASCEVVGLSMSE